MGSFTIIIDGREFKAQGHSISDINLNNGREYSIYAVNEMLDTQGRNVASYLSIKDGKLRDAELATRKEQLDGKWAERKASLLAGNPSMSADELTLHENHFRSLPNIRPLTSRLTATIVDNDGVPHTAYFMKETANQFRTFQPKVQNIPVEADPF
jgi:hypothetical protein